MDLVTIVRARLEHAQKALISANSASGEGSIIMMMHQLGIADVHINEARLALGDPSYVIDDDTLAVLQSSFEKASFKVQDAKGKIFDIGCRNAVMNSLRKAESAPDPYDSRLDLAYAHFSSGFLKDDPLSSKIKSAEIAYYDKHVGSYLASALRFAEKADVAEMEKQLDIAMTNGFLEDIFEKVHNVSKLGYKNALFDSIEKAKKFSQMDSDDVSVAVEQMENNVLNARLYAKRLGKTVEKVLSEISLSGYKNALNFAVGKSESTDGEEQQKYIELGKYCSAKIKDMSE